MGQDCWVGLVVRISSGGQQDLSESGKVAGSSKVKGGLAFPVTMVGVSPLVEKKDGCHFIPTDG